MGHDCVTQGTFSHVAACIDVWRDHELLTGRRSRQHRCQDNRLLCHQPLHDGAGAVGPVQCINTGQRCDKHIDSATTGEPNLPCLFVGHAEMEQRSGAGFEGVLTGVIHCAFDTSTADRPRDIALIGHSHFGGQPTRRRAERAHDRRHGDAFAAFLPTEHGINDVTHGLPQSDRGVLRRGSLGLRYHLQRGSITTHRQRRAGANAAMTNQPTCRRPCRH